MEYKNHRKSFVMMTEQSRTFALDRHRKCRGYLKIETGNGKGVMRAGAENLYSFEKGQYAYKLILFGKKCEKTIYKVMGNLSLNNKGKGEVYLTFDPMNVDGRGSSLEDFSVAIIVAASQINAKESLHPVLRGRLEKEESPFREEEKTVETYNRYYQTHLLEGCRGIENKLAIYDEIFPFKEDMTMARWKRIVNLSKFPMLSRGGQYAISRYRHFIFGLSKTHYFIGVPGRYLEQEQPEGGASGFVLWQPILGAEGFCAERENASVESRQVAYGYWIAAIHRETGLIEKIETTSLHQE